MSFFDNVKIYFNAGDGGNGACSFRREKYIPNGGPDGGNGGNGGDIILKSSDNFNSLKFFHFHPHCRAESGKAGKGQNRTGLSGENLVLYVPTGTQIIDENSKIVIFDFDKKDLEFIIAKGGKGGIGNAMFKSSTNQAPYTTIPGEKGESGSAILKLKLISNIGIIGKPNAGKSSFLNRVTNAHSKVDNYEFTTLEPVLGVIQKYKSRITLCDIPGLIEGAHLGVGLGLNFLQHIERCSFLLHLIDISEKNIIENYKMIRKELKQYNKAILKKQEIIVLNKTDLISEEKAIKIKLKLEKLTKNQVFLISTYNKVGIIALKNYLLSLHKYL